MVDPQISFHRLLYRVLLVAALLVTITQAVIAETVPLDSLTPFLKSHCFDCHSGSDPKAGLDLSQLKTDLRDAELRRRWEGVHDRVARGEMPPRDELRPDESARKLFLASLNDSLTRADA